MKKLGVEELEFYILKVLKKLKTEEELYSYFEMYIGGLFNKKSDKPIDLNSIDHKRNRKNSIYLWEVAYSYLCKDEENVDIEDSEVFNYLKNVRF
ncbi:hypothetical protein [Cetobacterium ceti]